MMLPCTLVAVVVLTFAKSSPRTSFPNPPPVPVMTVVPVPSAAPNPIILSTTVKEPPVESIVIPAYRGGGLFDAVNVRVALWKIRLLEIVQLSLFARILMPDAESVAPKKSKMLLFVMTFPVFGLAAVPKAATALVGRLLPAGPRLQSETVLLLFPTPVVAVWNRIFPAADPDAGFAEPRTVHLVTMLFCAPFLKRIVLVPPLFPMVVFENVNEFPPLFSPSMVTLVAPFRSTNPEPALIAAETVRGTPPEGWMETEV
jgi:hypothetical protein